MGATLSLALPLSLLDAPDMRMASRDLCDDETWSNTVRNRSTTSVQQRLHLLAQEPPSLAPLGRASRRLEFAPTDSVRLYVPDRREHEPLLPAWPPPFADDDDGVGRPRHPEADDEESEKSDGSSDEDDFEDALHHLHALAPGHTHHHLQQQQQQQQRLLQEQRQRRHDYWFDHPGLPPVLRGPPAAPAPPPPLPAAPLSWFGHEDAPVDDHDRLTCQGAFDVW